MKELLELSKLCVPTKMMKVLFAPSGRVQELSIKRILYTPTGWAFKTKYIFI